MGKVVTIKQVIQIAQGLINQGKTIILAGGAFDILHRGHVEYLEKSKQQNGILIVLLESDEGVRLSKGKTRPIHTQKDRAFVLSRLNMVDYVVCLPFFTKDKDYFSLVKKIKPDIITMTEGDPRRHEKELQAKSIHGKAKAVIQYRKLYSTTDILKKGAV